MIITISGKAGAGKSTVAKLLSEKLRLNHYSMGDLMRKIAKDKAISLHDLGILAEKDDSIDRELDKRQIELGKREDNFVIDGRLTAYFMPNANLKVFLDCSDKVRTERILNDQRKDEKGSSFSEMAQAIREREESERKRYSQYYGVDYYDKKLYDLVVDTTSLGINEVVEKIMYFISK